MANLALRVNGREYAGWKAARITRGIEAISGSFELEVSDRWAGQSEAWPIVEEDQCALLLEGAVIITGFVDKRSIAYSPTEHRFSVSGRDRAAALVDCSAVLKQWEYRNISLLTLARRLAEPFGISVTVQDGLELKPVAKLSVDPGDSAFDALEKACRLVGVLPVSDGAGGVVITRAGVGRAATELVEGQNIKEAGAEFDASGRFRRYVVAGQHSGSDQLFGEGAARVKAEAQDANVRRGDRVLMIRPESNATPGHAKQRAAWEAKVRAGRAASVGVSVQGWTQGNGVIWPVNALVRLRSPFLGIDGDMLITEATYSLDADGGTTTALTLKRPDAFLPEPVIAKGSDPFHFAPAPVTAAAAANASSEAENMSVWEPEP